MTGMAGKRQVGWGAALALSVPLAVLAAGCTPARSAPASSDATASPSGAAAGTGTGLPGPVPAPAATPIRLSAPLPLVPQPSQVTALSGGGYVLGPATVLRPEGGAAAASVARDLVALLRTSTGLALQVLPEQSAPAAFLGLPTPSPLPSGAVAGPGITVRLDPSDSAAGPEGYSLASGPGGVVITAQTGAGLFHGVQTLRQLLPVRGTGTVPAVRISDRPRYAFRSGELDVARHFFPVAAVEQYIDLLAQYKFNYLHLHLTDDQGWRIAITGRPALTGVGAETEVGGGAGGFYTAAQYRQIVAYAAERYITVIPEIDMPGHSNAALTAYPGLDCSDDGRPEPYTGRGGALDHLCTSQQSTYDFVDQVVGALASMTPGPYIDIGGDEAVNVAPDAYAAFMARAARIVRAHGKQPMAWEDAAASSSAPLALLGAWHPVSQLSSTLRSQVAAAARRGAGVVMEPADHAYLDQKYNSSTRLGLHWTGYVDTRQAYDWDPADAQPGLPAGAVVGVEAALWTETLSTPQELQTMLLPRLPAIAEVGWTPQQDRDWSSFRQRLADQGPRWSAEHLAWTRTDDIPWP